MKNFIQDNWPLILVFLYVISPIDFIPEALPAIGNVVGSVDDATLVLIQGLLAYKNFKSKK